MALSEKIKPLPTEQLAITQSELDTLRERVQIPRGSTVLAHLYRERPDPTDPVNQPDLNSQIVGRAIAVGIKDGLFGEVVLVTDCSAKGHGPIAPREERYIRSLLGDHPDAVHFITHPEAQTTRHEAEVFGRIVRQRMLDGNPPHPLVDIALNPHRKRVRHALLRRSAFGQEAEKIPVISAEDIIIAFGTPQDLAFLAEQMMDPQYLSLYPRENGFLYGKLPYYGLGVGWLADRFARIVDKRKGVADIANRLATRRVKHQLPAA